MKNLLFLILFLTSTTISFAQYQFTSVLDVPCTAVKNQERTGTCWSFATCSFLESELIRQGKGSQDLSEMYVVRSIYKDKALNYVLRQGKANFSQGSLSHDFINTIMKNGIVPENVYSGKTEMISQHNHKELVSVLKGFLDGLITQKKLSDKWDEAFEAILDVYLGPVNENFQVAGNSFNPKSYAMDFEMSENRYINLTSFNHHPFYEEFILEIPDNFSNGQFHNIPLDEMEMLVDQALKNGYTLVWDGDVSEKGFSRTASIAILSTDESRADLFKIPGKEIEVNQVNRQASFQNYSTTDDHLMHIVGTAKDQNGNKYYKIKNSWGEKGNYGGYLYMSLPYFKMKTVGLVVHESAIEPTLKKKLRL